MHAFFAWCVTSIGCANNKISDRTFRETYLEQEKLPVLSS